MADAYPNERLLPSLLDRLTDDRRSAVDERRDQRVGSELNLRAAVMRDLEWLMNTINLESTFNLDPWPELRSTVINYGLPGLSGNTLNGVDRLRIRGLIHDAIEAFEPRILADSLKVTLVEGEVLSNPHAIAFEIEGLLWGPHMPESLYLRTELDLELGDVQVREA